MKEIISASRRTDMPSCYLDKLIMGIRRGFAEVANPYSGKISVVDLRPEKVHTLVLWSKNFRRFLEKDRIFGEYKLYFLFTINDMPSLEPGVPPLRERLDQLGELARRYGPERVAWRFDPVVFTGSGPLSKLETFERIGETAANLGVNRVIFSFLDLYGKVVKRIARFDLGIVDPPPGEKAAYAAGMADIARPMGLGLESCCEDTFGIDGIVGGSCINAPLLSRLAGEEASNRKDAGQRDNCACTVSRDIGSYADMPCYNGCLYCYANPVLRHRFVAAGCPAGEC
ncbi:MAG: DUF1848 family protein [Candidatus Latescibacteria bacterium]|nr:DUF1848 family protein [Candidatus Latescibacterota bacterium]